eukprot:tig00020675_g12659.t1
MFNLFGRGRPSSQELRDKQVQSLSQHVLNLRSLDASKSTFEATVQVPPTNASIVLRISLPPNFPQEASPTVALVQPPWGCTHPWLDGQQVVTGHDALRRWSSDRDIGKVVSEIIREFTIRPPRLPGASPHAQRAPSFPNANGARASNGRAEDDGWTLVPRVNLTVPSDFPELHSKTSAELEVLESDRATFDSFIAGLDCIKEAKRLRADLAKANADQEQKNAKLQQEVSTLEQEVRRLGDAQRERRTKLEASVRRQQAIAERNSVASLARAVQGAAEEVDRRTERLAQSFIRGETDARAFMEKYMKERTAYHRHMAKREWHLASAQAGRPL